MPVSTISSASAFTGTLPSKTLRPGIGGRGSRQDSRCQVSQAFQSLGVTWYSRTFRAGWFTVKTDQAGLPLGSTTTIGPPTEVRAGRAGPTWKVRGTSLPRVWPKTSLIEGRRVTV